jgi:hypothetical protein
LALILYKEVLKWYLFLTSALDVRTQTPTVLAPKWCLILVVVHNEGWMIVGSFGMYAQTVSIVVGPFGYMHFQQTSRDTCGTIVKECQFSQIIESGRTKLILEGL